MWKLSKLEIRGFKSFADAAELDFPEGITAVVGPNGCGKSNISDAILWVLGEQSTRALRAQRMQDVIFQGTATRKAIGLAEVTLFLSNGHAPSDVGRDPLRDLEASGMAPLPDVVEGNGNDGEKVADSGKGAENEPVAADGIAIDASGAIEVDTRTELVDDNEEPASSAADHDPGLLKITRRLYRSGDSEYLLNGDKCRLRDIRDYLAGTGLGARACFLIGQGKIDQILSANSMDRRAPLEEAAGITLYRQRRHLTQLKLEATAQDLARIDDIYDEVARQMRSLKRQAGRARRYKKLRGELRQLERASLHGELLASRQKLKTVTGGATGARDAEKASRKALEATAKKLTEARNRLRANREAEQERQQGLYRSQLEEERLNAEARRQEDRLAFAEDRIGELERRAADLAERLDEAAGLQTRREDVAQEAVAAAEAAKEVLEGAQEELEMARRRLQGAMATMAPGSAEDDGEPRPLSADLVVEEDDFATLNLALGELLDVKVLPRKGLDPWLEETLDGNRRSRALRQSPGFIETPPPADDRIVGALHDRVSGRTKVVAAVIRALLCDTWIVADAAEVVVLAQEHAGHAFVDANGSCWACGVEVRARGRQARLMTLEVDEENADDQARDSAALPEPEVTSPEELEARENRDRAATAARAAEAQAKAAHQELAVSEAAGRRLEAERERATAEIETLKTAAEESRVQVDTSRQQAKEAGEKGAALEEELKNWVSDDHAGEAEAAELETVQTQGRAELEEAQEARSQRDIEAAEARVEGQHLDQQIRERLMMEPDDLLQQGPVLPEEEPTEADAKGGAKKKAKTKSKKKDDVVDIAALDAAALRLMIQEVQGKIDRLGPVNLMAYEDFEVQEARYEELSTQRKDLRDAAGNLDDAIKRIDVDCIQRFNDCFEAVNGYLNRIFRQLFGGGKAGMRLEDSDDPLNTGIEIFAQPPGKRLQNIRLLSGGERTLVALSLLFAIFEYRPAAFCILDEADAALDDPNIDRFLRALHSFENRTQFILITHNKRTMEIADLLYGVTMQESGVSQLVSVQLH